LTCKKGRRYSKGYHEQTAAWATGKLVRTTSDTVRTAAGKISETSTSATGMMGQYLQEKKTSDPVKVVTGKR
jgi:hypothetical protein